jgi:trigger factor
VNSTITLKEGLLHSIELELSLDELRPHFDKALAEVQSSAQIDGFRKGKVPMNIIKQRYGKGIEADALGDIANEAFQNAVKEHDIKVAGMPILKDQRRTEEKGAVFVIEYEVYPTIALKDYAEISVDKPIKEVTDEEVTREIDNMRLRFAKEEPAEQVTSTQMVVKLRFSEIDKETNTPLLGGKEREVYLDDEATDPILRNDVMNLKVNDSFRYTEEHAEGVHGDHAHSHDYHVTVTQITAIIPAELTPEFISNATNGECSTEEQLREEMRKGISGYWNSQIREMLRDSIVKAYTDAHEFPIPQTMVVMEAQAMLKDFRERNAKNPQYKRMRDGELMTRFLPYAEKAIKWQLIASEIVQNEKLELTEDDFERVANQLGINREQVRAAAQNNAQLTDRLMTDRIFDFLELRIAVNERPLDDIMSELNDEEDGDLFDGGDDEQHEHSHEHSH